MSESQPVGPSRPRGGRPVPRRLRRARIALYAYFFVTGSVIAIWASRIPAVKRQTGVDEGELGIALLALALGGVLTIRLMGGLLDRFDGRTVVPATALATSAALVAPGYATNLEQLVLSLLLLGSSHALLNVSANLQAARLQREWGRPIMVSFHAVCSIGGGLGAIAGTLCVKAGLEVTTTFIGAASLLAFLSLAVRKWLTDHPLPPVRSARTAPRLRRLSLPRGRIMLLGLLALCCMLAEGAATDWSALYTREAVGGSETAAS
ncbi:MFS transporter, partial [Thermobifida halotolerans]